MKSDNKKTRIPKTSSRKVNRKSNRNNRTAAKPSVAKWWWRVPLVILILGLLYWQWSNFTSWIAAVWNSAFATLGWGLLLILVVIIVIVMVVKREQIAEFARRYKLYTWNRWLGGAFIAIAIWGVLALARLGGSIGDSIIDYPNVWWGLLRVIGLFVVGIILVAPGRFWRAIRAFRASVAKQSAAKP